MEPARAIKRGAREPGRNGPRSRSRTWLRRCGIAVLVLVVAAMLALAGGYALLRTSLPQIDGSLRVAGIEHEVEIIRDQQGVPQIFAMSEPDAYFALGFVHAQDRLFQMESMRLTGQGRLSEVLGSPTVSMDRFMRALNIRGMAEASFKAMSEEAAAPLVWYAAGVNAWLENRRGMLPPEFLITGHAPEPWQPQDSLLWGQLMTLQLSGNWREELVRMRLLQRFPEELIGQLWPRWPTDQATTIQAIRAAGPTIDLDRLLAALPDPSAGGASNEWVVDGRQTTSGRPLLANDPHLGLGAPGQWHLARVNAPGLTLAGAFAPGVPALILGHNGRIAWGFTTTNADLFDVFIERVDASDPSRYLAPEGPRSFETREERIRVKGQGEIVQTVRTTRHGVVISDLGGASQQLAGEGTALALAFPGFHAVDRTAEALFALNRAGDWGSFRAALENWHAPMQNIVFADVEGTIGFIAPGRVPLRKSGDGWLPQPGWTGEHDWIGFARPDELPQLRNPAAGYLVNANNRIVPDGFPIAISRDWDSPYRALRIRELIDATPVQTVAGSWLMLSDSVSLFARTVIPSLAAVAPPDERSREAIVLLAAWDGSMRRNRPEPLIFHAWLRELYRLLLADELGPDFPELFRQNPALVLATLAGNSPFCDDITTPNREACLDIVRNALAAATSRLVAVHGPDMTRWRWGDVHRAPFRHPLFSRVPVLRDYLAFAVPTDGDFFTINRGATRIGDPMEPFAHVHGAGYKAVYDLADLDASRFMVVPGQSGNPLSPHYGDLAQPWADRAFLTLIAARDTLRAQASGALRLLPAATPAQ